jgi:HEAT repeat protein
VKPGDALAGVVADPVLRVRAAAVRALAVVGEFEHVDAIRAWLSDSDRPVCDAAPAALNRLASGLDRPVPGRIR